MHFLEKNRRGITLLTLIAFFGLVHITAMPLPARSLDRETIGSGHAEQGAVEQEGLPSVSPKKGKLLTIALAVAAVGVLAAILIFVVFKTTYDITGSWKISHHVTWKSDGHISDYDTPLSFSGTKTSGTFTNTTDRATGTYQVTNSKTVHFLYDKHPDTYDGQFDSADGMSGTIYTPDYTGTWTATRQTTAAANPAINRR